MCRSEQNGFPIESTASFRRLFRDGPRWSILGGVKHLLLFALLVATPAAAIAQKPDPSAAPATPPPPPAAPDAYGDAYQAGYAIGQMAGYAMCCCCPLLLLGGGGGLAYYLIQRKKSDQGPGIG